MNWRVAPGLAAIAAPAVGVALLLSGPPAPVTWPHSPPEPPLPKPKVIPRWDKGSEASLELLRHVTAQEARRAERTLSSCETAARHLTAAKRPVAYRKCALGAISRAGSFATSNSHMLTNLLNDTDATQACHEGVLELSGTTNTLAITARTAARGSYSAPWGQLLAASRSIRGLAHASLKLASAPALDRECKPRKPGPPPPTGPVA